MKTEAPTIRTLNERGIVFRRQAAALKPAMNRNHVQVGVRRLCILVNVAAGGPAREDIRDGVICCHNPIMTETVIL